MSKLPDFLEPIDEDEFRVFGVKGSEMDRADLLKVIKMLSDEMHSYKKSAEEAGDKLNSYLLERGKR